jgi:hemerythrin
VLEHFSTEERLREVRHYAQFSAHKSEHDTFVRDGTGLLDQIGKAGLDSSTTIVAFERSLEWTSAHVRGSESSSGKIPVHTVEDYIHDRSEAHFTHSLCPECAKRLCPRFDPMEEGKA